MEGEELLLLRERVAALEKEKVYLVQTSNIAFDCIEALRARIEALEQRPALSPGPPLQEDNSACGRACWSFDGGDAVSRAIWKYPLPIQHDVSLSLPAGAIPLSVGVQREPRWFQEMTTGRRTPLEPEETLVLWALVNTTETREQKQSFHICGTGHPLAPDTREGFLGTVQMPSGLVWHVFFCDREKG